MRIYLILLSCLFLGSCNLKKTDYLVENTISSLKGEFSFEAVQLVGDSLILPYYAKMDVWVDGSKEWLYGYNHTIHALDVFDLIEKKISNRIYLQSEGPDAIDRVYQIKVIGKDSIAVMQGLKMGLIDNGGKVIKNVSLVYKNNQKNMFGYFYNYNDARIAYQKPSESFILHFMNETVKEGIFNSIDLPLIFGEIDLLENVKFIPVSYPEIFFDREGDVAEHMPNYSVHQGKLIYGFTFESNIYTFDLTSKERKVFGGKSTFSQNMQDFELTKNENYRLIGTWFNSMVFDPKKNLYYRTHWGNQPPLQLDLSPSTALTKPGYVMIFDKYFSVISEIELPYNYWLEDSFMFSEGLAFWSKDQFIENEEVINLGILKFRIEN
jgi:hypothetical protein